MPAFSSLASLRLFRDHAYARDAPFHGCGEHLYLHDGLHQLHDHAYDDHDVILHRCGACFRDRDVHKLPSVRDRAEWCVLPCGRGAGDHLLACAGGNHRVCVPHGRDPPYISRVL